MKEIILGTLFYYFFIKQEETIRKILVISLYLTVFYLFLGLISNCSYFNSLKDQL